MREYTRNDCSQTGYDFSLKGKVVVLDRAALPPEHPGQLFLYGRERGKPEPHRAERVPCLPYKRGKLPVHAQGCDRDVEAGTSAG